MTKAFPGAVVAVEAPPRTRSSNYPPPFFARMAGREKRPLGDLFGLANFGVNLTRLAPGGVSALRHAHSRQDEFVYVLAGCPTLVTDTGETPMSPGMCAGFKAGTGNGPSSGQPHRRVGRLPRGRRSQRRRWRHLPRRRHPGGARRRRQVAVRAQGRHAY